MAQARNQRKRAERRREPGARREEAALAMRRRVKALLTNLGLLGLFERMPSCMRDQFYACCYPDPQLVFDPSFPSAEAFGGTYAALRQTVRDRFPDATVDLYGFDLAVRDYWAIVLPLSRTVRGTLTKFNSPLYDGPKPGPATRAFLERAAPELECVAEEEVRDDTYTAIHEAVLVPLVARSQLDVRLLHGMLSFVETPRGHRLVLTLYSEQPAIKYVRLRNATTGGSRPMHRVGTCNTWNGIEWASWSPANLKGHWPGELRLPAGAEWPVYVQSHALKQLRTRLDVYDFAEWGQHWMYQSLRKPKIVSRLSGDELLVAFEANDQRLGYLVVTARDGLVAVRTFLFLTMAQTPEGRMLERRLKLTRDELAYLRLHELSRFTHTDLKDDPQLRQLLTECGCGQLFDLAEDEDALRPSARAVTPFAAELKQYVGMAA